MFGYPSVFIRVDGLSESSVGKLIDLLTIEIKDTWPKAEHDILHHILKWPSLSGYMKFLGNKSSLYYQMKMKY